MKVYEDSKLELDIPSGAVETVQDFAISEIPFDQLAHDHRAQLQDYLAGKVALA